MIQLQIKNSFTFTDNVIELLYLEFMISRWICPLVRNCSADRLRIILEDWHQRVVVSTESGTSSSSCAPSPHGWHRHEVCCSMALFRLEDLLAPRAETNVVLDLSTARPRTQQEFDKLLSHVPEFRIKPEKVRGTTSTVPPLGRRTINQ